MQACPAYPRSRISGDLENTPGAVFFGYLQLGEMNTAPKSRIFMVPQCHHAMWFVGVDPDL